MTITYYPAFQNVRTVMEELHILLTPEKEHKKVHINLLIIVFWNGKSLKDFSIGVTLPKINKTRNCEKKLV